MDGLQTYNEYVYKNQKKLRCGVTTGSCATAAVCACCIKLLLGKDSTEIALKTPKGAVLNIPVTMIATGDDYAEFMVIKDSGDDPDVTNNAAIHAKVNITDNECYENAFTDEACPGVFLDGGIGIGRVTMEGLEQSVGQAAINVVPRKMIFDAVKRLREQAGDYRGLHICISIPFGEQLAKKTFNERLGIKGGLSILGTSGIIEPMSERAIVDTIEAQIKRLAGIGVENILVTPGNYGQGYVKEYLKLDLSDSIKCSNYVGETIDLAVSYGMKNMLLVGNIGKLVKLAAGIMNTHSRVADGRGEIFGVHAAMCGASSETVTAIMKCINTDLMLDMLDKEGIRDKVMDGIIARIEEYVNNRAGDTLNVGVVLFSEKYGYLGKTVNSDEVMKHFCDNI